MLKCKQCNDNYLYKIFVEYMETFNNDSKKAGRAFNILSLRIGDPRPILLLLHDITDGSCERCNKYKSLYDKIV